MKTFRKTSYLAYPIFLLLPFLAICQNTKPEDILNNKIFNAAREIMTAANNCALITLDENENPMVRVMDPFLPESDFTVWFGTNPKSRKVQQIKNNPKVALYYLDSDASGYVVIHGMAQLVDDQQEKEKHWKSQWEAFYPNKNEAYLLIKVTPEWMEVLSYTRGIKNDSISWQVPVVMFDSKTK